MLKNKTIIEELLDIINHYDNNDISKERMLNVEISNDSVLITRLYTKGEVNKGTPFYSGNTRTMIITEQWHEGKVIDAWIVAENKNN